MECIRLNLGCNRRKIQGYINVDIDPAYEPDLVCDITKGLPYPDNSVCAILAFDILEHIPTLKTIPLMNELWRVLMPGGTLNTFTPDAEHGQGAYMDPTHINFWSEGRWLYFSDPRYRALYNIEANFEIVDCKRSLTDPENRVYHLRVIGRAVK